MGIPHLCLRAFQSYGGALEPQPWVGARRAGSGRHPWWTIQEDLIQGISFCPCLATGPPRFSVFSSLYSLLPFSSLLYQGKSAPLA